MWIPSWTSAAEATRHASPAGVEQPGYYGLPMLKEPLWGWQIAWYFLLEGISAGAYLLSAMALFAGDDRDADIVAAGRYVAVAALVPCPPLLIADLGRPERFHHMLRVFKPSSPMNTGAWALTGYAGPVVMLAFKQWAATRDARRSSLASMARLVPARSTAAGGVPMALTMISYPGVLLSTTSTPVWAQTRLLGALIACSSMSTGAAAVSLVVAARDGAATRSVARLHKVEHMATAAEAVALAGYLVSARATSTPLTKGPYSRLLWGGAVAVGLIGGTVLRVMSARRGRHSRTAAICGSAATIAGGWALKWAIVHAGQSSARDPLAAHAASRPEPGTPGWAPSL